MKNVNGTLGWGGGWGKREMVVCIIVIGEVGYMKNW